jgi:hypothetical protein
MAVEDSGRPGQFVTISRRAALILVAAAPAATAAAAELPACDRAARELVRSYTARLMSRANQASSSRLLEVASTAPNSIDIASGG